MRDDGGKRSQCSQVCGQADPLCPTAGLPVGQGSPWGRHVPELPPQLLRRDGKFFLPVNCRVWRLLPAWLHTSISRSCAGLRPGPAVHAARAQGAGRG